MTHAFARRGLEGLSPGEAAAHWRIRHDAGDMSAEELQQFDSWLADSPASAAAWARAEMAWALFDSARSDAHLDAMRASALAAPPAWRVLRMAVAAGLALVATLAAVLLVGRVETPGPASPKIDIAARATAPRVDRSPERPALSFETAVGQRIRRRLADGTIVTLNTNSALEIAYRPERRTVRLLRGQALFEVAKDRHRPFVVEAAGREITALGTVFEVRLDPGGMHVLLAEGRVSIVRARLPGLAPAHASAVVLSPGHSFFARLGELDRVAPVNVESALLWRNGLLDFDDVTLAEASAELNRYSNRRLVVRDPAIAALRISGVFRSAAPERFANAVSEVLPVATRQGPNEIEIVAAGPPETH
jgi:transmembrane sensor